MVRKEAKIRSVYGLHARPSAMISEIARSSDGKTTIQIENPVTGEKADARSLLSLLALALETEQKAVISVEGVDEEAVLQKITEVIEGFVAEQ